MKNSLRFSLGSLLVLIALVAAFLGGRYQRQMQQPKYVLDHNGSVTSIRGDFLVTGRYVVDSGTRSIREDGVTLIEVHADHILLEMGMGQGKVIFRGPLVDLSWRPSAPLQTTANSSAASGDVDGAWRRDAAGFAR